MIVTMSGPQSVGQVETHFKHGDLFLSPEEYQREQAWKLAQKKLLIDTIFRKMDIPKFYLWKIDQKTLAEGYPDGETKELYKKILENKRVEYDDPDPYIFEVVDGQQRIRSILEYMGTKPPEHSNYRGPWLAPYQADEDTPMARGRSYDQLNAGQQIAFSESPLTVMVLEDSTIYEVRDMFLRLQNGTPLKAQQKRDAMGSAIGRKARELSRMTFFTKSVNFDNSSSDYNLTASEMLSLELHEKIVSCRSPDLDKLYKNYMRLDVDPAVFARTRKVIDVLGKIFEDRNPHLNKSYALSLYWLISRILTTYTIDEDQYKRIQRNFEALDYSRLEAQARDYTQEPGDEKYQELSLAMSRGNTAISGITTRHEIIGQFLFVGVELVPLPDLDPNRNYSYEERLILYHRGEGRCQLSHNGKICGKALEFDDTAADHIVPYSKGGTTCLENGRIANSLCNTARGTREDFDPETKCRLVRDAGESDILRE